MSLSVGVIGACGQLNGRAVNLGYVQSSLQAGSDGSISIVYQNGDKCGSGGRYSTRVIFQCDDSPVSTISLFDFHLTLCLLHYFLYRSISTTYVKKMIFNKFIFSLHYKWANKEDFCFFTICRAHQYLIVRTVVNTSLSGGPLRHARLRKYKVRFKYLMIQMGFKKKSVPKLYFSVLIPQWSVSESLSKQMGLDRSQRLAGLIRDWFEEIEGVVGIA